MKATVIFSITVDLPAEYDDAVLNVALEQDILQGALEKLEIEHGEIKIEDTLGFNMSNDTAKFIARLSWEKAKYYNYQGFVVGVTYSNAYQTDRVISIEKDGLKWDATDWQDVMPEEFQLFESWKILFNPALGSIMVPGWKHVQYN